MDSKYRSLTSMLEACDKISVFAVSISVTLTRDPLEMSILFTTASPSKVTEEFLISTSLEVMDFSPKMETVELEILISCSPTVKASIFAPSVTTELLMVTSVPVIAIPAVVIRTWLSSIDIAPADTTPVATPP